MILPHSSRYCPDHGYVAGPYDQHVPNDSPITINSEHNLFCGHKSNNSEPCKYRLGDTRALRRHLRKRHELEVRNGKTPTSKAKECGSLRLRAMQEQPIPKHIVPILWVVVEQATTRIDDASNVAVHIRRDPNAFGANTYPEWFEPENVKKLQNQLGEGLAYADGKLCFLHQDIVFTEVLRCYHNRVVHYFKDVGRARKYLADHPSEGPQIIMLKLNGNPSHEKVDEAYSKLQPLLKNGSIIYPGREEYDAEKQRYIDMDALDEIAKDMKTWRPKTCKVGLGGHHNEACSLIRGMSVTKRTHSVDGRHVMIHGSEEHPACKTTMAKSFGSYYEYIHQEYVPSLIDYGEFRLFMTVRKGKVKVLRCIITTQITGTVSRKRRRNQNKPREPDFDPYLHLRDIDKYDIFGPAYPGLTSRLLRKFAKQVYKRLLQRKEPAFRSLLVGGRLDCGIDRDGKGFFVGEITRHYNADKFSREMLAPPHDMTCKALANDFNIRFPALAIPTKTSDQDCPLRAAPDLT
jgi:hypothetical protein